MLVAAQRAARDAVVATVEAALSSLHAGAVAGVVTRYADRRAALSPSLDPAVRAAELRRSMADEAAELARLAADHAGHLQRERRRAVGELIPAQQAARRALSARHRHHRIGFALALHARMPARLQPRQVERTPLTIRGVLRNR